MRLTATSSKSCPRRGTPEMAGIQQQRCLASRAFANSVYCPAYLQDMGYRRAVSSHCTSDQRMPLEQPGSLEKARWPHGYYASLGRILIT